MPKNARPILAPSSNSTAPYYSGLTFIGGRGNDTIAGSVHDDRYIFNLGDGADTIAEMPSWSFSGDELRFGAGMAEADHRHVRFGLRVGCGNAVGKRIEQRTIARKVCRQFVGKVSF
jgi:Ca2+-binding RTX toxin-like protein